MSKISPCLWFDGKADEAAQFYSSVFQNVKIKQRAHYGKAASEASGQKFGSLMTVLLDLEGLDVLLLNGGPHFKFSPACSFFVACKDTAEIESTWKKLSAGGTVRIALDKYPWAERYGWTADKYGVNWQLMIHPPDSRKVTPDVLFVDKLKGRAKEAIDLYMSVFPNSKADFIAKNEQTGLIDFSSLRLAGEVFHVQEGDGNHGFAPNEAFSFMIECKDQKEVDHYWNTLTSGGGEESPCGWLKDKFGVSWQIVSDRMNEWHADPIKGDKMMAALVKMRKPDLAQLEAAARS